MLLQRLVQFAEANDGGVPPFYARKPVRWVLALHADGTPVSGALRDLADPTDPQRRRGVMRLTPAITKTSGIAPTLAVDTPEYVFGWVTEDGKADRVARQHEAFRALIDQWAAADGDTAPAKAIAAFYRDGHAGQVQPPDGWARDQLVALQVDGQFAAESPSAIRFWSSIAEDRKGSGITGICLVCGRLGQLLKTVPQQVAKRWLPGATQSASLVSMNEATHGYQLTRQLTHTPICGDCGLKFMGALDALLSSERHSVSFSGQGSRFVWWLTGPSTFDPMRLLNQPDDAEARDMLRSAHRGVLTELNDPTVFCSVTVSGNVARVVVRDWVEMPLSHAADNLETWFADCEVVDPWTGAMTWPALTGLVRASGRWDRTTKQWMKFGARAEDRPHDLLRGLVRAALFKASLPPQLLSHVLFRVRADGRIDTNRAALIRLALRRHPGTPDREAIMSTLNLDSQRPAYVSGRIFAVLDDLQRTVYRVANQQVGTSFSERYFGRAIVNPRAVLTRNRPTAEAWLRRLRGPLHKPGYAAAYLRRLDELYQLIPVDQGIPAGATLVEQGEFVLGYHHQRAHMYAQARAARDANAANDLPPADTGDTNDNEGDEA